MAYRNTDICLPFIVGFVMFFLPAAAPAQSRGDLDTLSQAGYARLLQDAEEIVRGYNAQYQGISNATRLNVLGQAYGPLSDLVEMFRTVYELKDKKSVEDYLDFFQDEAITKLKAALDEMATQMKQFRTKLPEIKPLSFPLSALFHCRSARLLAEQAESSIAEMETAKVLIQDQITVSENMAAMAEQDAKKAWINSQNLKTLVENAQAFIDVGALTTAASSNIVVRSQEMSDLGGKFTDVAKEANDFRDRIKNDLSTIEVNLAFLYQIKDAQCQDDELEKLKAEAQIAEIEGNRERVKEIIRRIQERMQRDAQEYERQRVEYEKIRQTQIERARGLAAQAKRERLAAEQNMQMFMQFLGGFATGMARAHRPVPRSGSGRGSTTGGCYLDCPTYRLYPNRQAPR